MKTQRIERTADLAGWGGAAVRISFGVVWLVDAAFKWLPAYRSGFLDQLRAGARGQPAWLQPWFHLILGLAAPRPGMLAIGTAIVETFLAVALLTGFARKPAYLIGAVYSLLVWATADGFGGPYTASSTDVGPAIIYSVVFLALLVIDARSGPAEHSLDHVIERRWPRWGRGAEIGAFGRARS